MEGVVKFDVDVERFVAKSVPPTDESYQRNVPVEDEVADSETVPVPHRDPLVMDGAVGTVLITAFAIVRVALVQVPLSNST